MFYSRISFFSCSDLFGTDHRFPLPLRGLRPRTRCIDRSSPYCPFRCIVECSLFWYFYVLVTSRVFFPPQRKQVIGRKLFRLLQDLQYDPVPRLFSPNPSVKQSLNLFSAL